MSSSWKAAPVALVLVIPMLIIVLLGTSVTEHSDAGCGDVGTAGGGEVDDLTQDQWQVAKQVIAAVRADPATDQKPHAAVIVLATGFQESRLRNLDHGDRDSLGFLQQRPSQGWGTPGQVRDVAYATRSFLARLVLVPGWETRRVTDVAADVQRPAEEYRGLYQQWVPQATKIVEGLWATSGIAPTAGVADEAVSDGNVRLVQANLWAGMRAAAFNRDMKRVVGDRPDFVTLNEVYARGRAQLEPPGYASWHPVGGPRDQRDTAVLWRTDLWRPVDRGVVLMHERPVKWGTRYVTWVTLTRVNGGGKVSVIAAHASPGGVGREGLYAEFRTRLIELIKQLRVTGPVLVGGDLNVRYPRKAGSARTAFETAYAAAGARATYSVLGEPAGGWVTDKGGGTIDYILTAGATATSQATGDLAGSDHRTVSAVITLADVASGAEEQACGELMLAAGGGSGAVVYPVPVAMAGSDRRNWGGRGGHWSSWHTGTDFSLPCGAPVLAATDGTIQLDTTQSWSGQWLVKVTTGPGRLTTWYAHMQSITVAPGQRVRAGQQIGEIGSRGNATGCHLHFEVHLTGGSIYGPDNTDPSKWLTESVSGADDSQP